MKEKIKAELTRRIDLLEHGTGDPEVMKRVEGVIKGYKYVLEFLDTIDEEGNTTNQNNIMTREELLELIQNDEEIQRAIKSAVDIENDRADAREAAAWV